MLTAIAGILAIAVMWCVYAAIAAGWGSWYLWLFRKKSAWTLGDFLAAFWIGLATLFAVLQLWHFFLPIDFAAHVVLTMLGALAFLPVARPFLIAIKKTPPKIRRWSIIALVLTLAFLANRATGPGAYWDSGLYHIAAVKWTSTYPIVPGLANLHMRFGFSSTLTLMAALMNHGGFGGHAYHLQNGLFLAAISAMVIRSAARILSRAENAGPQDWVFLFVPLLIVDWAMDIQISSYSTDLGVAALSLAAAYYFLELFSARAQKLSLIPAAVASIAILAGTVTAKPSALALAGPMLMIVAFVTLRSGDPLRWRAMGLTTILGGILVASWLARQIILTGYPLYPSEAFRLNVDWAVPHEKVAWLRTIILNWARWQSYDETRGHWQWLDSWWHKRILDSWTTCKAFIPMLIAGPAMIAAAALVLKNVRTSRLMTPAWLGVRLLLACLALALLAWWITAPDPRYGTQLFILIMAIPLALLASMLAVRFRWLAFSGAAICAILPLAFGSNAAAFEGARTVVNIVILPPKSGLFYGLPEPLFATLTTPEGVTLHIPVPREGETFENRIWDGPLPSCPDSEVDPKEVSIPPLRLRRADDLRHGFWRPAATAP